ncbi:MAG: hypothetical protein ACK5LR_02370 [Mangrovibacterium sp.]
MKKLTFVTFLLLYASALFSQETTSVEKSIWGVQIGINPIGVYNESRLTNDISLRSEVGFGYGFSDDYWAVLPQLMVEPRYYYNLNRRSGKNKQIRNNSGNYLSLNASYLSGDLAIKSEGVVVHPSISIIPMYGLRRNMGAHFNFEFACGLGYGWTFKDYTSTNLLTQESYSVKETDKGITFGIRLAVGLVF